MAYVENDRSILARGSQALALRSLLYLPCALLFLGGIPIGISGLREGYSFLGIILISVSLATAWLFFKVFLTMIGDARSTRLIISDHSIYDNRIMIVAIPFAKVERMALVYNRLSSIIAVKIETRVEQLLSQTRFRTGCLLGVTPNVAIISIVGLSIPANEIAQIISEYAIEHGVEFKDPHSVGRQQSHKPR